MAADRVALVAAPAIVQNHLGWHTIAAVNRTRRSLRMIMMVATTGGGINEGLLARHFKSILRSK